MDHFRLTIETIPFRSRWASLANLLCADRWNEIRRAVYRRAGYRCDACGRQGRMYAHELWHFNEEAGLQNLLGLRCLCQDCHRAAHILFVRDASEREGLLRNFADVNRMSVDEARAHLRAAERRQSEMDRKQWAVSFGQYNNYVPAFPDAEQRGAYIRLK